MRRAIAVLFSGAVLLAPLAVFAADSQADLRAAIQASVLADPRTASIPPSQLTGLVDALVSQAQAQNMSAADILWQPRRAEAASVNGPAAVPACPNGWEGYLCQLNMVFGFDGGSYDIAIIILIASAFLIAVIWELIVHHHKKMAAKAAMKAAKMPPVQQNIVN